MQIYIELMNLISKHNVNRPDPRQLHRRVQVEGDAHPAEVRRPLLHRQARTQVRFVFSSSLESLK